MDIIPQRPVERQAQNRPCRKLWVECALWYLVLPLLLWRFGRGMPVLPVLWAAAAAALGLLAWQSRRERPVRLAWGCRGFRRFRSRFVWRAAGVTAGLTGLLWLWQPAWLFAFPLQHTRLWLLVIAFYPLFSVLPQGIVYRALFYERYAFLWQRAWTARLAAAAAFSLAHLVFHNGWALLLTFVGGWLFAGVYARTRSVTLSCLEHALYGNLVFTIGWGPLFYHGSQAIVERL